MLRAVHSTELAHADRQPRGRPVDHRLVHGARHHQLAVVGGHGEGFGNLAVAPLGDPVHGAGQQPGSVRGQGLDAGFLCHTPEDETARPSVTGGIRPRRPPESRSMRLAT